LFSFSLSPGFQSVTGVTNADGSRTTWHFRGVTTGPLCDTSKTAGNPRGCGTCDTCDTSKGGRRRKMKKPGSMTTDRRRYGVSEVRRINAETYWLTIGGRMWSEVEWSRSRRAWCIQDAAGQCLAHVEHIVGQDRDPQAAIRLAKRMIVDGRMPAPEEA